MPEKNERADNFSSRKAWFLAGVMVVLLILVAHTGTSVFSSFSAGNMRGGTEAAESMKLTDVEYDNGLIRPDESADLVEARKKNTVFDTLKGVVKKLSGSESGSDGEEAFKPAELTESFAIAIMEGAAGSASPDGGSGSSDDGADSAEEAPDGISDQEGSVDSGEAEASGDDEGDEGETIRQTLELGKVLIDFWGLAWSKSYPFLKSVVVGLWDIVSGMWQGDITVEVSSGG